MQSNTKELIFVEVERNLNDCLNKLEEFEYKISKEEIDAGTRMFRRFLEYCIELGIIDEYWGARIPSIFREYSDLVERKKKANDIMNTGDSI